MKIHYKVPRSVWLRSCGHSGNAEVRKATSSRQTQDSSTATRAPWPPRLPLFPLSVVLLHLVSARPPGRHHGAGPIPDFARRARQRLDRLPTATHEARPRPRSRRPKMHSRRAPLGRALPAQAHHVGEDADVDASCAPRVGGPEARPVQVWQGIREYVAAGRVGWRSCIAACAPCRPC